MTDRELDANVRTDVDVFLARVHALLLTTPFRSAFREADDGPEGEAPPDDPDLLMAVKADRFDLMTKVRELRHAAQQELPLDGGTSGKGEM